MTDETRDQTGPPSTRTAPNRPQHHPQEDRAHHPRPTLYSTGAPCCPPRAPLDRLALRAADRAAAQHCGLCRGVLDECVAALARVHIPVVLDCVGLCGGGPGPAPRRADTDKAAAAHACGTVLGLAARVGDIATGAAASAPTTVGTGLRVLVELLAAHTVAPAPVLVAALVLVDRAAGGVGVDSAHAHALFAAAFVVAGKYASDAFSSNRHCARVAGLALAELNAAERALLAATHGALAVAPAEYAAYAAPVAVLARAFVQCGDLLAVLDRIMAQEE